MESGSFYKVIPAKKELQMRLYMHHLFQGPNQNQTTVIPPSNGKSFGWTAINDWTMYDGRGPDAKVVARAQGLHIQAGMKDSLWYNSLNVVFEDARFKGSTLQVMGTVVEGGDWAIVGGTGEFTLAEGVIYKNKVETLSDGDVMEVTIQAFYTPLPKHTWGNN
ncbi:Dirigent protein [Rhynchospora pubera]|uniref:Dirigent protein n=1 Tax=Rhynchospora pubera TaxID=906938 RepID=A0AAV8HEK3_9POAL|nr:Dirigent protein [Rhynchospora pubera]